MKDYKRWTAEQRWESHYMTKELQERGIIEKPRVCACCGYESDKTQLHNKNYDVTLTLQPKILRGEATPEEIEKVRSVLVPLCWRCHTAFHKMYNMKLFEEE